MLLRGRRQPNSQRAGEVAGSALRRIATSFWYVRPASSPRGSRSAGSISPLLARLLSGSALPRAAARPAAAALNDPEFAEALGPASSASTRSARRRAGSRRVRATSRGPPRRDHVTSRAVVRFMLGLAAFPSSSTGVIWGVFRYFDRGSAEVGRSSPLADSSSARLPPAPRLEDRPLAPRSQLNARGRRSWERTDGWIEGGHRPDSDRRGDEYHRQSRAAGDGRRPREPRSGRGERLRDIWAAGGSDAAAGFFSSQAPVVLIPARGYGQPERARRLPRWRARVEGVGFDQRLASALPLDVDHSRTNRGATVPLGQYFGRVRSSSRSPITTARCCARRC